MHIISRTLVSASLFVTFGFSGILTGISVVINNEPITLYEIHKYSEQFNIPKKEAFNLLVRQKLEKSQIKKLGISADIFEVDKFINNLASKNGLNRYQFINMLKEQDIDIDKYKEEIKAQIKRDKLMRSIYRDKIKEIEEEELKAFYEENLDEFKTANNFIVSIYSSQNPENLKAIQNNPMLSFPDVKVENKTIEAGSLNPKLKGLLNSTKQGSFTQILTIQNTPTMFFMKEKKGSTHIPFEDVKNNIYRVLSKKKKDEAVKDYFEKLKASAIIHVLRPPS